MRRGMGIALVGGGVVGLGFGPASDWGIYAACLFVGVLILVVDWRMHR